MEEKVKYEQNDWGKIPKNARTELAYSLVGNAMGLAGEGNAAIARVLNGEKISANQVQSLLNCSASVMRVVQDLIRMEAWSSLDGEPPF